MALTILAPLSLATPFVPDALAGSASATTFQVLGRGVSVEGGAYDHTDVCAICLIRLTITGGNIQVADPTHPDGAARQLGPGEYEIREYAGVFGIYDLGPHDFILWLEGAGKTIELS